MAGILYLCATPIGNLEDMTFRAARVLGEVDFIAAEDTRHTRKLLTHFDLHTPLISYHEHNKFERGPELISMLLEGKNIAVVSDAGLPGIADPGSHLAQLAIEEGIIVTPLPGANAALSGLICSGLDTTSFLFVGFLPKTSRKRREVLESIVSSKATLLFYESPHRLKDTLKECITVLGERKAVACRELTKKFEEFVRGTLSSLQEHFQNNQPRGEFTLIIEGNTKDEEDFEQSAGEISLQDAVEQLIKQGADKKTAMKEVAVKYKVSKRDVYQALLGK
ncbi:16S rRNA (cytidine(1402)-2'-O)-methyltransferase [Anaerosinus sp.]|uniref:16S rRNA (cytidine(1402)-2'-O)-methyltransferase n=1 Tax=Selenobaculum sp. TaxID=3074374 RepID=UPI0015B047FD